jgi:hypothetical protein
MLFLEIQCGKEGMKDQVHHRALGATAGCTVRMNERSRASRPMHGLALSSPALTCHSWLRVHFSGEAKPRAVSKG